MSVILFAGECYYARGGLNDLVGVYNEKQSAYNVILANANGPLHVRWDWWQIVDQATVKMVDRSECTPHGVDDDD